MINPPEASSPSLTRIAVVINTVTPYMRPLWSRLAERSDIDLLLVTETPMERDRRWQVETDLPVEHVQLDSWTLDLAWMAVGSGFKTRFDSYVYVPKRPLAPLRRFSPHVVVAAGGGCGLPREHRRSCRPAPLRLGGRALVEHVHARETQPAQACRGTVGSVLLQIRRCLARRWFETCP